MLARHMTFRYGFALDRFGPFREMPQYALTVSQALGAKTQKQCRKIAEESGSASRCLKRCMPTLLFSPASVDQGGENVADVGTVLADHRDRVAAVMLVQGGTAEAVMPTGWGKLGGMDEVEVQQIGAEPLQAGLDPADYVSAREASCINVLPGRG
jgi:hypothetical protein